MTLRVQGGNSDEANAGWGYGNAQDGSSLLQFLITTRTETHHGITERCSTH